MEALISAMHDTEYEKVFVGGENISKSEWRNLYLENEYRKHEAYLKAADNVLTASQVEMFDTFLSEQIKEIELQWERSDLAQETQKTE